MLDRYMATSSEQYREYQSRYKDEPRESDKKLIKMFPKTFASLEVLDAGCSTGNLIRHLRAAYPQHGYYGYDILPEHILEAAGDSKLNGVKLAICDIAKMDLSRFDVVIFNAVLCLLDDVKVAQTLHSVRKDATILMFDYAHPHNDLTVIEKTEWHPNGLTLRFRSYSIWASLIGGGIEFYPFEMPFKLTPTRKDQTRTVESDEGRLSFRGSMYQPLAHGHRMGAYDSKG